MINAILGEDRVIVSDIEGTTRDAIDTYFESEEGQKFLMIDTAGMRKRKKYTNQLKNMASCAQCGRLNAQTLF